MRPTDLIEQPLLLGESRDLFSILTVPIKKPSDVGVIILNAGLLHNVGPFRLSVDISKALSRGGVASLRIDQSGKGETPMRRGVSRRESVLLDFDDAMVALRGHGIEKVILIGLCSGADDALFISLHRPQVTGMVLLDGYARRTLKYKMGRIGHTLRYQARRAIMYLKARPTDPSIDDNIRDWESDALMVSSLNRQLSQGVKILAVFTRGQDYYGYLGQLAESLSYEFSQNSLEEVFFENSDHTYSSARNRAALVSLITSWVGKYF